MLNEEQRKRLIEKIINSENEEVLFQKLNLDLYDIFSEELAKKSDDELIDFILD